MRINIQENERSIREWISESKPKAFICRQLSCRPSTLETALKKLNIAYEGNRDSKGRKSNNKKTASDWFTSKDYVSSHKLRLRLIEEGYKKAECEHCGGSEWMGHPIPLELHHKDGNRFNNGLENLAILCPNCHSLTPNHSTRKSASVAQRQRQ